MYIFDLLAITSCNWTTLGCLISFIVEISRLICSTILWRRTWLRSSTLMA
uniref:CIPK9 n=1 Tax=Arundo donax TaxID=35708 RepID=A0A0A9GBQ4_ARUDO